MDSTHPDAFKGFRYKLFNPAYPWLKHLCPLFHGYGGWNLTLDAYGPGQHFRACCSQCNGHGRVGDGDKDCIHDWQEVRRLGRCLHEYKCTKCPSTHTVDSSG